MTTAKRICISVTPELERKIINLRRSEQFCRKSISELVRMLIEEGMKNFSETA